MDRKEEVDGTYKIYTTCRACGKVGYHSEKYSGDCTNVLMTCVFCGSEHRLFYHADQKSWKNADTYTSRKTFNPFD